MESCKFEAAKKKGGKQSEVRKIFDTMDYGSAPESAEVAKVRFNYFLFVLKVT